MLRLCHEHDVRLSVTLVDCDHIVQKSGNVHMTGVFWVPACNMEFALWWHPTTRISRYCGI